MEWPPSTPMMPPILPSQKMSSISEEHSRCDQRGVCLQESVCVCVCVCACTVCVCVCVCVCNSNRPTLCSLNDLEVVRILLNEAPSDIDLLQDSSGGVMKLLGATNERCPELWETGTQNSENNDRQCRGRPSLSIHGDLRPNLYHPFPLCDSPRRQPVHPGALEYRCDWAPIARRRSAPGQSDLPGCWHGYGTDGEGSCVCIYKPNHVLLNYGMDVSEYHERLWRVDHYIMYIYLYTYPSPVDSYRVGYIYVYVTEYIRNVYYLYTHPFTSR